MSDYKIRSIGKIDFRKYKDVVRVIATKKKRFLGFFVFFSKRSIFYPVGR